MIRGILTLTILALGTTIGALSATDGQPSDTPVLQTRTLPAAGAEARPEPIEALFDRVARDGGHDPEELATGRFLRSFETSYPVLAELDLSRLQSVVRTPQWVRAEAPFERRGETHWARIRMVVEDGHWKVEDLRTSRGVSGER